MSQAVAFDGFRVSLPSGWQSFVMPPGPAPSHLRALGYIGTIDVPTTCRPTACDSSARSLSGDGILISFADSLQPFADPGSPGNDVIDDMPVRATAATEFGGEVVEQWSLPEPTSVQQYWLVTAMARGSDETALRAAIRSVVHSIIYDPPVLRLDGNATAFLAARVAAAKVYQPRTFCYPEAQNVPSSTVFVVPGQNGKAWSVPVTCESRIDAMPRQLWRVTLTIRWDATTRWKAGMSQTIDWLDAKGTVVFSQSGGDPLPGT